MKGNILSVPINDTLNTVLSSLNLSHLISSECPTFQNRFVTSKYDASLLEIQMENIVQTSYLLSMTKLSK